MGRCVKPPHCVDLHPASSALPVLRVLAAAAVSAWRKAVASVVKTDRPAAVCAAVTPLSGLGSYVGHRVITPFELRLLP